MRLRFRLGRLIDIACFLRAGGRIRIGDDGYGVGIRMIVSCLQSLDAGEEKVCQELDGNGAGAGLLVTLAADEAVEGLAGVRDEGEGEGELLDLVGVLPVLQRIKVAFGGAGAGAPATATGWTGAVGGRHCEGMVGCMFWKW